MDPCLALSPNPYTHTWTLSTGPTPSILLPCTGLSPLPSPSLQLVPLKGLCPNPGPNPVQNKPGNLCENALTWLHLPSPGQMLYAC